MFSVNGTALDNTSRGWRLMRPTNPLLGLTFERMSARVPGRHGVLADIAATLSAPVVTFVVLTPKDGLEALMQLWLYGNSITYTGVSGKSISYELLSFSHEIYGPSMEKVQLTVAVRLPDVFWRGSTVESSWQSASGTGAQLDVFPGQTGITQDAQVRIRGPIQDLQITDPSGAFIAVDGSLTSGQILRIDTATGRAFLSSNWSGGTEASGEVEIGGPRDVFTITPVSSGGSTTGRLTMTQASYSSGAAFQVRGRAAYLM